MEFVGEGQGKNKFFFERILMCSVIFTERQARKREPYTYLQLLYVIR